MLKLVLPSSKYKKSFLEAAEEYRKDKEKGRNSTNLNMEEMTEDKFNNHLKHKLDQSKGINIPKGRVPATEYWLVDDNEFIGIISIRHRLNAYLRKLGGHIGYGIRPSKRKMGFATKMLGMGLQKAKKLGLDKVLITCDETNFGSKKVIENNGGILENTVPQENGMPTRLRYWIKIK
ncbi:MAG: GNAT family N-acetyltransferase [Candidatus Gracilibacteria bacterium]|jgi:predicted acetyltransferase